MYSIKLGCGQMYCGRGAVEKLEELPAERKRAYIVMSGILQQELGQLKVVTDVLEKAGFTWKVNTDVEPEPSFETVLRGAADMAAFAPDWVIGFGGGSAMDAAKAMWVFYENPAYRALDDVMPPHEIKDLRVKARLACIPTSAGTGSEATRASLIKDTVKKRKYSIRCMKGRLVPDVAILDPVFTLTMPKGLTAASGMDALTHAIESYVTPGANPFSDAMAMASFRYGYQNLATCYEHGDDLGAREKMLAASCMGGIAFSNCALGLVHGIAHTFGAEYGVPHGLANAIALPYGVRFNSVHPGVKARYRDLAGLVGEEDLLGGLLALRRRLDVPNAMRAVIPAGEAEFLSGLDALADKAFHDVATPFNPVTPTPEEMKALILEVYYGEPDWAQA